MNRHVVAALFFAGFLLLAVPVLLMQQPGAANASITAGFVPPLENRLHFLCLLAIGGLSVWLGREMMAMMPLGALLMLLLGGLSQLEPATFPEVRGFTVGTILLFALTVSMMRRSISLMSVVPVAAWAYFAGSGYIAALPHSLQPLYFLIGLLVSAALLMAIGETLLATCSELISFSFGKLKTITALASLFIFF